MSRRKPLPIGPLALALRHRPPGSANRVVTVLAVLLGVALAAGAGLLLLI